MNSATIISKQETFYIAYAPDFDVSAYGACRDEALNNLQRELVSQPGSSCARRGGDGVEMTAAFDHGKPPIKTFPAR